MLANATNFFLSFYSFYANNVIFFYLISSFCILYDIAFLKIHLLSIILLIPYCDFKILSFVVISFILLLIHIISLIHKKTYIHLGDILMLSISCSDIEIDRLFAFLLCVGVINFIVGIFYMQLKTKNAVPMMPAILLSWIIFKP